MKQTLTKQYLGIDIGGTSAKYAYITEQGVIGQRGSFETGLSVSKEAFLDSLFQVVNEAVKNKVSGIGICSLGFVHPETGQILGGVENMPYLNELNLRDLISKHHPALSVQICNDVKAIARAEEWVGAAKGCANFLCIALGTGLGGAIVIDSELVEGAHFRAGEIGYMDYKNEDDYLEKYSSTKYVMEEAAHKLGLTSIDGFEFFRLVKEQNSICLAILEEWVQKIARFLANIIVILDLEKVIIGGGISQEKDLLIPGVRAAVNTMLPPEFRGQTSIEAAQYANDAGMLGAVSTLLRQQKDQHGRPTC